MFIFLLGHCSYSNIRHKQTVAAIFSLLTDYRLAHGKASFGFLNPLLYSNLTTGFNDITSGNNPGCGTNGMLELRSFSVFLTGFTGFTAKTGWDPVSMFLYGTKPLLTNYFKVTGWGSPDFLKLQALVWTWRSMYYYIVNSHKNLFQLAPTLRANDTVIAVMSIILHCAPVSICSLLLAASDHRKVPSSS